jgi:hypothetical protein
MNIHAAVVAHERGVAGEEYAVLVYNQIAALNSMMAAAATQFACLVAPIAAEYLHEAGAQSEAKSVDAGALIEYVDYWFRDKSNLPGFGSDMTILQILPEGSPMPFEQLFGAGRDRRVGDAVIKKDCKLPWIFCCITSPKSAQAIRPKFSLGAVRRGCKSWIRQKSSEVSRGSPSTGGDPNLSFNR